MLNYDKLTHQIETDGQPDLALVYLQRNYPPATRREIMDRIANRDRGRRVVLCKSCLPFVSEDGSLKVIAEGEDKSITRLCDYAVDPVTASAGAHRERWHDHTTVAVEDSSGRSDQDGYVLGRSIQEFAPAIAALTDGEEMVLALVHPLCLFDFY